MTVEQIVKDPGLLVAVAEVVAPSLNGASSDRYADVLELAAIGPLDEVDSQWLERAVTQALESGAAERWHEKLVRLKERCIYLLSVCDSDYPSNLRMIANRPPLLFVWGKLRRDDSRAIAVVGTRKPSDEGRHAAYEIAAELTRRNVTVVSGLAEGIDTAAHLGALEAGGRTIAVFGTGIENIYPTSNRRLASYVSRSGACVSQFLPNMRGTRWSFPVRNVVTSGLSIGTVVVEAGETSGARLQAQEALRHGKRLFLLRSLVSTQAWAKDMANLAGVVVLDSVDEIMVAVDAELPSEPALL